MAVRAGIVVAWPLFAIWAIALGGKAVDMSRRVADVIAEYSEFACAYLRLEGVAAPEINSVRLGELANGVEDDDIPEVDGAANAGA